MALLVALVSAGGLGAEAEAVAGPDLPADCRMNDLEQRARCLESYLERPRWRARVLVRLEQEALAGSATAAMVLGAATWGSEGSSGWFRAAAEGFAARGDASAEALARHNLFLSLLELHPEAAAAEVERVESLADRSEDPEILVRARLMNAEAAARRGERLDRVHALLNSTEPLLFPVGDRYLQRKWFTLFANVCVVTGRLDEARATYRRQLAMLDPDNLAGRSTALVNLVFVDLEELREAPHETLRVQALERAEEALTVAERADHWPAAATAAQLVAFLSEERRALGFWERCLDGAPTGSRVRAICMAALALDMASEEPARARRSLADAADLLADAPDFWSAVYLESNSMRVAWEIEPVGRAREVSRRALEAIERLRGEQEDADVRAGLFSLWSDDYLWVSGRLLREAEKVPARAAAELRAEAFEVTERMRARALYELVVDETRTRDSFASLADAQAALAPDEALLSFQIGPWENLRGDFGGGAWLFVITRDRVRVRELPNAGRVELRRNVDLLEGLFAARNGSESVAVATLGNELLGPTLEELPETVRRLIVVPDDALYRLPLGALRTGPREPPLAARYELVVVPSVTLWRRWRSAPPPAMRLPLLAYADPVVPQLEGPLAELAGLRLPRARSEGRAAVRWLSGGSRVELAAAASEARFKGDLAGEGSRIVHFAAHAFADDRYPERSAILLASGAEDEDGLLQAAEISRLDLKGQLVVLSSCRGGGGRVLRGEGMMSLARAFFAAGARAVVASPWPLRDDRAEELFDRFYRRIAVGDSVTAALAAAQRAQLAAGVPAADWAGLVVLGDGDLVPLPEGASFGARLRRAALPLTSLLLAVIAIVLAVGHRRNRQPPGRPRMSSIVDDDTEW